jgi:hypothetical protein
MARHSRVQSSTMGQAAQTPATNEAVGHESPYMLGAPVLIFTALVLSEALGLQGVRHALASFAGLVLVNIVFLSIVLWFYGAMNRPLAESKLIVSDAAYVGRMLWFDLAGGMLLVALRDPRT